MSNARYSRKGDFEESANEFSELVTNSLTSTDITRHIVNVDDKTKRVEIPVNQDGSVKWFDDSKLLKKNIAKI